MKKGWHISRVSEIATLKPPKSEARDRVAVDAFVSFIPMEDLGVAVKYPPPKQTRKLSEVVGSYTYFAEGDVLLAKITPCFENGKLGIATGLKNGIGFGSSEFIVLRPNKTVTKEWLFHFLSREDFRTLGAQRMSGAVGQQRVPREYVEACDIPIPPLNEQQRIVGVLDEAFASIATAQAHAERNLQNARALFESHLHAVFTKRGEGWVERPLKELTEKITKGSSPKWQGISYVEKPGILFVTSENVGTNRLLLDDPKFVEARFNEKDKKSILKRGDVLTNIVGASIGRTAVFDGDDLANINQAVCLIRCIPKLLNNRFLAYFLNSPILRDALHAGEVNMARANLSLGFISELLISTPKLDHQAALVEEFDAFKIEIQRLESICQKKSEALAALKKSLLHQAFSGNL
jgi:type I restriction enzyme S subunit